MPRSGGVFDLEFLDESPGWLQVAVSGKDAFAVFQHEGGGHRWQRIPPTERRGRVQTSTVTVAILDPRAPGAEALDPRDVDVTTARGSGPGGQKRNKTESCIVATHRPSGLTVRIDNERSQHQNRALALAVLAARLSEATCARQVADRNSDRRQQVGTGQRGDKVRTYRTQDDQVTDHRTGTKTRLSRWCDGDW